MPSRQFQSTPAIAGGRIRSRATVAAAISLFQSTPAIAGGRIAIEAEETFRFKLFQSTPAIAGGRIPQHHFVLHRAQHVSIHARHCWRANPLAWLGTARRWLAQHVSIHARHCWRANPRATASAHTQTQVSIHARHCWRANPRCRRPLKIRWWFQSTPAIAGGRIHHNADLQHGADTVSIHARHCWRANPLQKERCNA